MATESYWNLFISFGIVLEASLIFILREKLVVLAVLGQQLFDTDYLFWNYLKVLLGSGQTARNFVFGFSGLATPILEESLSFGYLDQSQSCLLLEKHKPSIPCSVEKRILHFIRSTTNSERNLGFGGQADILASPTGYQLQHFCTEPWQVIVETERLLFKQLLEKLPFGFILPISLS